MMRTLRKNAKYVLWIVLSAFLITIVGVWGAKQAFLDPKSNPDLIAKIGKTEITYTMLSEAWQTRLQQLSDQGIKVSADKEKEMKKELLNALIERQLQLNYAKKLKITSTSEEVAQSIMGINAFSENGVFNKDRYVQYLTSQRINPSDFENEQRDTITLTKLRNMLSSGIKVTSEELKAYFTKRSRKVSVNYVYFNYKNFLNELKIDEEKMKDYYAINKKNYTKADRIKASHILIRPDASPTSPTGRTDEGANKFAKELLARLKAGESFDKLAKKYSQDPGTASKGGNLDWFSKGMMVPEFENAALALKVGGISDVVKTQFGYHLIKVTDKEAGFEPTYTLMRSKVQDEMQKQEGLKIMKSKAQTMRDDIKDPSDLEKMARKNKVQINEISFSENSKPSSIKSADFSDVVLNLNKDEISDLITGDNGFYIAKIISANTSAFNETAFKKSIYDLTSKLKNIKYKQEQNDLLEKLRRDEKVVILDKNI